MGVLKPQDLSWEELIQRLLDVFDSDKVNIEEVEELLERYKSDPRDWKRFAKFDKFKYTRNLVHEGNGKFNLMLLCWAEGNQSTIHDHANAHCFVKVLQGSVAEISLLARGGSFLYLVALFRPNARLIDVTEEDDGGGEKTALSQIHRGSTTISSPSRETQRLRANIQRFFHCFTTRYFWPEEQTNPDGTMAEKGVSECKLNGVTYMSDELGLHRVENPSHSEKAVSLHLYSPPFKACNIFDERTCGRVSVPMTFWSKFGQKVNRKQLNKSKTSFALQPVEDTKKDQDNSCKKQLLRSQTSKAVMDSPTKSPVLPEVIHEEENEESESILDRVKDLKL